MDKKVAIKITLTQGAKIPEYQTIESAGADIHALLNREVTLTPGSRELIPTGIHFEIPPGYEIQVRPRSGLALKHGITVLNAPGTIDSDYRGELRVILINLGNESYTVKPGERIAQIIVSPVISANFVQVEFLTESVRGAGGFGHTGK